MAPGCVSLPPFPLLTQPKAVTSGTDGFIPRSGATNDRGHLGGSEGGLNVRAEMNRHAWAWSELAVNARRDRDGRDDRRAGVLDHGPGPALGLARVRERAGISVSSVRGGGVRYGSVGF
jgi:hypothetical protein